MRKSRYVTFLLAGAAATTRVACDQNNGAEESMMYSDPSTCAKEMDAQSCNEGFETARTEHVAQAPKFTSQAECEAVGFSPCEQAEVKTADGGSGGSFFMPMMMGYMMGRMLSPGAGAMSRPVYSDKSGYLYSRGANVGRVQPGATSLGPQGMATRVTTRGGFGGGARSYGGGA